MAKEFVHVPVLLNEVVQSFALQKNDLFLDCTLGGAGHAKALLEKYPQISEYFGIDQDAEALAAAKRELKSFKKVNYVHSNFKDAVKSLEEHAGKFGGILVDLGVSSYQIDNEERGFSFQKDGKLDMRMNTENEFSAWSVVNGYSEKTLADIIFKYGEEKESRRIAAAIVARREKGSIETTLQLQQIVASSVRGDAKKAVQKVFQAIRIEVNGELDGLGEFVKDAFSLLRKGGRLAIISFHSLEDRIVKNAYQDLARGCICPPSFPVCVCGHIPEGKILTKKPVEATEEELKLNRRSSSAKLRVIEKL